MTAEDYFASAEADNVFRGFFTHAGAGTGDDDGLQTKEAGIFIKLPKEAMIVSFHYRLN